MKNLYKYIMEDVSYQYLITNVDDAISYIEAANGFKKVPGLTPELIKEIYATYDNGNYPAPIVANYHNKRDKFTFRRWVGQIRNTFNELGEFNFDKIKAPYQGLHDTNMKEDNKYIPSAEDMEILICFGHNKQFFDDASENMNYCFGKKKIDEAKFENLITYYNNLEHNSENVIDKMVEPLKGFGKLSKLQSQPTTEEWVKWGSYDKKPNGTPKTDIISTDNKRISVKKMKGAQAASGYYNESKATIYSCIDDIEISADDKKLLDSCFADQWLKHKGSISDFKKDNMEEYEKNLIYHKNINKILYDLLAKYPDLKKAIVYEAMSGEKKFGKKSPGCADHVFLWDDMKGIGELLSMEEYVEKIVKKTKIEVSFKTIKDANSAMRILI